MAAITDGFGPGFVTAASAARRALPSPPVPTGRTDRQAWAQPAGRGESNRGDLVRLYEARGRAWTEAAKARQLDQALGRLSEHAGEVKVRLEQVKLYPPYPIDEFRRAETIREFNGLAAEVRRMNVVIDGGGVSLRSLAPNASTDEAERAVGALTQAGAGIEARRAGLAAAVAAPGAGGAESRSLDIGSRLGDGTVGGISRQAGDLLRQVG